MITSLILGTRNAHKVQEIQDLLPVKCRFMTLADFPNAPSVREDADSFCGNAAKKAVALAAWISNSVASPQRDALLGGNTFVLADDSGLEVDALNGLPGVHSARFAAGDKAGPNTPDAANNSKLLKLLEILPSEKRLARFRCVIALAPVLKSAENQSPVCYSSEAELRVELFEGVCEGRIDFAPRGDGGFGYDSLFVPQGFAETFAELGATTKNQISHRAKAIRKLSQHLFGL